MKPIEISLVIATGIALAASGFLLVTNRQQASHLAALEQRLGELRERGPGRRGTTPAGVPAGNEGQPVAELLAAGEGPESDLGAQIASLAMVVEKLEQTARGLDSRITQSRLAVPTADERKAQIKRGEARLEELRKSADEAREKTRQVATAHKIPFDEKRLLDLGTSPALDEKPDFAAARDTAAAQARVAAIFEKKLADLRFATIVEALPPTDER